jgi:hypothetical protein
MDLSRPARLDVHFAACFPDPSKGSINRSPEPDCPCAVADPDCYGSYQIGEVTARSWVTIGTSLSIFTLNRTAS